MKALKIVLLTYLYHSSTSFYWPTYRPRPYRHQVASSLSDTRESSSNTGDVDQKRSERKSLLLGLLGSKANVYVDPVLACPFSNEPLEIETAGPVLGASSNSGVKCTLKSQSGCHIFEGRTDTYFNLLQPIQETSSNVTASSSLQFIKPLLPPPLRSILSISGILADDDYIPMRDLFTSPSVSFAYERGWRQGFAAAGFPGVDQEFDMVREYFQPIQPQVVVDMSCATGLFTRRFAKSNIYTRVIGCDYSNAMLLEARSRISRELQTDINTRLDLVRCDVAKIPMQSSSVDALHAGAAMHCWPDVQAGLCEIYRVLKPGGRYFATTFLSRYFKYVQNVENRQQAFQYFESLDQIKGLLLMAGFDKDHIEVTLLGEACIIIKAEKI